MSAMLLRTPDDREQLLALLRRSQERDLLDAEAMSMIEGVLQVASFHPQYQFADTEADDLGNLSNRSPFPTLHLLREDSIERAVAAFPDAGEIYERNIETLRRLGHTGWRRLFTQEPG
jgi:hypothetical protein